MVSGFICTVGSDFPLRSFEPPTGFDWVDINCIKSELLRRYRLHFSRYFHFLTEKVLSNKEKKRLNILTTFIHRITCISSQVDIHPRETLTAPVGLPLMM